jgi:hypothetical protein
MQEQLEAICHLKPPAPGVKEVMVEGATGELECLNGVYQQHDTCKTWPKFKHCDRSCVVCRGQGLQRAMWAWKLQLLHRADACMSLSVDPSTAQKPKMSRWENMFLRTNGPM